MQMEVAKKKSKIDGLKALIAQMHKAMMAGDGDDAMSVNKAVGESVPELKIGDEKIPGSGEGSAKEEASESKSEAAAEGDDLQSQIKSYMKKKGGVPIKGKTVMMKADFAVKKPMMGKKKYG